MPSAKQQPSNIKHDVGIRPNVCKLTFGPPCIMNNCYLPIMSCSYVVLSGQAPAMVELNIFSQVLKLNLRNVTYLGY